MFNLNQLKFSSQKNIRFANIYTAVKVATILLALLAIFFVNYIVSTQLNSAEKFLQQAVLQTASNLKGRITTSINEARILSANLTNQTPVLTDVEILSFLKAHVNDYDYRRLIFTYPSGKTLRVKRGGLTLPTMHQTGDRFKKVLDGDPLFIGTKSDKESPSRYVNEFGVPVYNKDGKIIGVLGAIVDSSAYIKILGFSNYKEKGMTYVVYDSGDFAIKPERDSDKSENFLDRNYQYINTTKEEVRELLNTKDTGIFVFKNHGQKYVASFARIGTTDCNVLTVIPLDVLTLHVDKLLAGIALVVITISSLLLALLYYSGKLFKEHEKVIYDTVFVDTITQEGNKNKFKLDAKSLLNINKDSNYAIISIAIKRFKTIGELYGTEKANQILKDFSKMIHANLPKDSICARDYNATFAVLYKYDKENFIVKYFIEKLIDEINVYNETNMQQTITNSGIMVSTKLQLLFGVYLIDDKELSIDQMCEKAIIAKKQIKEDAIKAYSFYDNNLKIKLLQKRVIEDEMHSALASGQFHMYLQPKFSLQSGNIAGAEALVRWIHPSKGLIPPIDFIPLFEQNGFVIELDKCIWRQACEFLAKRKKEGLALFPISVNVSRLHLHNDAFINELLSLTSQYEVEPKYLELELTESASYEDEKRFKTMIKRLKELNFTIAMDDFGTGYSSLSILKDLPFDVLKLDRGFVKDATNNLKAEIVIKTMIDMANKLNMTTVAEGIETEDQADLLRGMGCNIAQGFLYGKPMSVSQFEEFCELNREEHQDIV